MRNLFAAVPLLLLTPVDSELCAFAQEAVRLADRHPELLGAIEDDLDCLGKNKKAMRQADRQWREEQTGRLEGFESAAQRPVNAGDLKLGVGRPRTPALAVFLFLLMRGFWGGPKDSSAATVFAESSTLQVMFFNLRIAMPKPSTLVELCNTVSNETRRRIMATQALDAKAEGLDDFSELLIDSTATEANSQWPVDSEMIAGLLERVQRTGKNLKRFGIDEFQDPNVCNAISAMLKLDKRINMSMGRKGAEEARRRDYSSLIALAHDTIGALVPAIVRSANKVEKATNLRPSLHQKALASVGQMQQDISQCRKAIEACKKRVIEERKVAASEKVYSRSDPTAAMIVKGGREPVLGYKPQLVRSRRGGFICAILVPQGNTADSSEFEPAIAQAIENTQRIPDATNSDDGYASAQNREAMLSKGVKVVSMSGAKGKKITPQDEWDSEAYRDARNGRSAVESLMFTIKYCHGFGRLRRRGLAAVEAELLEKVLAYNLLRTIEVRRRVRLAA